MSTRRHAVDRPRPPADGPHRVQGGLLDPTHAAGRSLPDALRKLDPRTL